MNDENLFTDDGINLHRFWCKCFVVSIVCGSVHSRTISWARLIYILNAKFISLVITIRIIRMYFLCCTFVFLVVSASHFHDN